MIVRELVTKLGFAVNDSQMKKYESGVNHIKQSAENAASAFRNMFAAFVGVSALRSLANTADTVQNLEARLSQVPQTTGNVGDAFDELGRRASDARQPIREYISLYTRIGHAAKDYLKTQEDVIGVTDTVSKGLIVGGATAQESASVMIQLSQALGSGTLQGEEFRAFAEAAPQMLNSLSEAMGIPRENLKKLASQGKITTKDLLIAFQKIAPEIEAIFKAMPMTISQATTIIANRWDMFIARLNRKSETVTKIADFLLYGVDKIESGLNKIVDFFGGATNTIKMFGIAIAAAFSPLIFQSLFGAISFLVSPLGAVMLGITLVGVALEDLYQYLTGGESIIGDFVGEFKGFAEYFSGSFAAKIWETIVKIAQFFYRIIPFAHIFNGIKLIFGGLLDVVLGIVGIVLGAFKILFGVLTGDFDSFWGGIKSIFEGIWSIVKGIGKAILGAFIESIIAAWVVLATFVSAIGTFLYETIWGSITGAVKGALRFFGVEFAPKVTPEMASGAASSPSGVPNAVSNNTSNITINQTLPPGSTPETAAAAKDATTAALKEADSGRVARQMGAY